MMMSPSSSPIMMMNIASPTSPICPRKRFKTKDSPTMKIVEDEFSDVVELPIEDKSWLARFEKGFILETTSAPVSEIFSVKLDCHAFLTRKRCKIYGEIEVQDEDGISYVVYSRNADDPETITHEHNLLSLCTPEECIVSINWIRMSIRLMDSSNNSVIVVGAFTLDKVNCWSDYDRVKSFKVKGLAGSASVRYATLLTSVMANPTIKIRKDKPRDTNDNPPDVVHLFGTIVARYVNTYGIKFPEISLFHKSSDESIRVDSLKKLVLPLSREVLVVPANSFLRIVVDLYDSHGDRPFLSNQVDFRAGTMTRPRESWIAINDFIIKVAVNWFHPYSVEKQKKSEHLAGFAFPRIQRAPVVRAYVGCELLEVFSVMIHHNNNGVLNICGRVCVDGYSLCIRERKSYQLFNREETRYETLSKKRQSIPIEGNDTCLLQSGGGITIDLWECNEREIQPRVYMKGEIGWNLQKLEGGSVWWYGRRRCSVIPGVNGYVGVFYSIFSHALQASVGVTFRCGKSNCNAIHLVHGAIFGRYSSEDYSSSYEKTYYQVVLLNKPRKSFLELKSGSMVPLLKPAVAVPTVASLIVEVDLYVECFAHELSEEERVNGIAVFDPDKGPSIALVGKGEKHGIELSVKWCGHY